MNQSPAITRRQQRPQYGPTASSAGLRLTTRGRIVIFGFVALVALVLSVFIGSSAQAGQQDAGVEVTTITIADGETLWSYAKDIAEPGDDIRDVVELIKDLNNLTNSQVRAGQQLVLPA